MEKLTYETWLDIMNIFFKLREDGGSSEMKENILLISLCTVSVW